MPAKPKQHLRTEAETAAMWFAVTGGKEPVDGFADKPMTDLSMDQQLLYQRIFKDPYLLPAALKAYREKEQEIRRGR